MKKHWTLDDINWSAFDASKVDPAMLQAVKAAALVEYQSHDYVTYLCNVFAHDAEVIESTKVWGEEEVQHGAALARWAALADPSFDFARAQAAFVAGFRVKLDATQSIRGSEAGELIARCVVECGTSSFYSALRDACDEPVLKEIAHRIAGDEFRHYKLFYDQFKRYQGEQKLSSFERLKVAFGRISEASDDELAMAYYAGNDLAATEPYDLKRHSSAYLAKAGSYYRFGHIQRAFSMVLKACEMNTQGWLSRLSARVFWWLMQRRNRKLASLAA